MSRRSHVESILSRLRAMRSTCTDPGGTYALEQNIRFMRAIRNPISYLFWLVFTAPGLDGTKLKELTDYPVEIWDVNMHTRLIEMQRNPRIGLIEPLVNAVVQFVSSKNRNLIISNFGAGGMEVDRQIIDRLHALNSGHKTTILSFDRSAETRSIARSNLSDIEHVADIIDAGDANADQVLVHIADSKKSLCVIFISRDIFSIPQHFPNGFTDLVYHSLFKHHLNAGEQSRLDEVEQTFARKRIEFDGWFSIPVIIPQTIVGWNYPEFLNAELFSNFRFRSRKELHVYAKARGAINFHRKSGFYLLEYTEPVI